jgi:hypothetical protein
MTATNRPFKEQKIQVAEDNLKERQKYMQHGCITTSIRSAKPRMDRNARTNMAGANKTC